MEDRIVSYMNLAVCHDIGKLFVNMDVFISCCIVSHHTYYHVATPRGHKLFRRFIPPTLPRMGTYCSSDTSTPLHTSRMIAVLRLTISPHGAKGHR